MVGHTLAHYRIEEQIGAGGMGVVYRAHDTRLDRQIAIKVLPEGTIVDETARRRLRNEARLLSRLNHPNVATIHDFDTADGVDFLVMELVPGVTLSDERAAGPLPPHRVAVLGEQLADGVAAAHRAGIIHRDLKPSNLRVTPDGRLKVLDFGIARLVPTDTTTTATEAAPGRHAGTLRYMAPEQLRGAEPSERTDIYATGVVLYEMATGRPPFSERPDSALIEAILRGTPQPPSASNREVPASLEHVILKAMDKDPARRYHAEQELGVDLRRIATASAAPSSRSRAALFAAMGLVAVLAVVVASVFVMNQPIAPQPDASGRLRLAILPPRNLTGLPSIDGWPAVAQILLVGELTGVETLGVMDPESLNTLLATPRPDQAREPGLRSLAEAHVALALQGDVVKDGSAYTLRARLIDPASGESRYSTAAPVGSETDLVHASRAIAASVLRYLQLETKAGDQDLRPWIRSHSAKIDAVKAFLQANADIYRVNGEEGPNLRKAIEIDPDFIAPRVWLAISLNAHGQTAEAAAEYDQLKPRMAAPFERAMIEFTGARLARDIARQEQALTQGLQYSPNNNILLMQLGSLQAGSNRCEDALRTMAPAIAMRWRYRNLYPTWGWCAVLTGRAAEAAPVLREAAEFESLNPRTIAILEAIALSAGDATGAAAYRARYDATHQRPELTANIAPLFEHLGRECLDRGKALEAAQLIRRAADQDPENATVQDALGLVLKQAGDVRNAEAAFRKAAALDRSLAHPHLALGELAEAGRRTVEAVSHYRDYVAIETDAAKAAAIHERIARLSKTPEGR